MSTAGAGRDALATAGSIRANTEAIRSTARGDVLQEDALLTRINLGAAHYSDAELMVRRLGNRHGCRPQGDPGNCPDPHAHAADLEAIASVLAALTQVQARETHKTDLGLRTNASRKRSKPGTPAS